jgi:SWIM zinc finger
VILSSQRLGENLDTNNHKRRNIMIAAIKPRIFTLEAGKRYAVPSSQNNGAAYEVIRRDGYITCTCKGYEYRQTCKHVIAVKAQLPVVAEADRLVFESRLADLF